MDSFRHCGTNTASISFTGHSRWIRPKERAGITALLLRWLRGCAPAFFVLLAACGGHDDDTDNSAQVAPSITTQPASVTRVAGQRASFSVVASGSAPLAYQWRKNGADIAGASAASYTTPVITAADNGAQFSVVVSNSVGSVTSNGATLTAGPAVAPSIVSQPASTKVVQGTQASFSVSATGSDPLVYQWRRNGIAIAGATAASHTTPATALADNGASYTVVVSNAGGRVTSNAAVLGVSAAPVAPTITTQPSAATVNVGQTATFSVVASGTAPLAYQWRRNGVAIAGATAASYTTPATVAADNGVSFSVVVSNGTAPNATSSGVLLTVTPLVIAPRITAHPASVNVIAGATATFSVVASGSAPLAYQWRKNGAPIAGATAASYTTPATVAGDNGALFSVAISNAGGTVTSNAATLMVGAAVVAPNITSQPSQQSVTVGQTATFSVVATGSAPLAYQWRKNGKTIVGATAATYTTPATVLADNGAVFSVVVRNAHADSATSNDATLTVTPVIEAPAILTPPTNVTVSVGQTASFSVGATGSAPLAYQWRKNGTAIVGATAATYTTPPAVLADNGALFSVVVSNAHPSAATSSEARLDVVAAWSGIREDGAPGLSRDSAYAVATDAAGNVVIAGSADAGNFSFDPAGLNSDAYVAKYSAAGTLLWAHRSRATGSFVNFDDNRGVATDAAGNIYAGGRTGGVLPGEISAGATDVTVSKYGPTGTLLWARQFGSSSNDEALGAAVDAAGNVFVVGSAGNQLPLQPPRNGELFIAKYDTNGNRQWIRQWGSGGNGANRDSARGVAVDAAGNAYMAGYIPFAYGGTTPGGSGDAFAAKYDTNGNQVWFSRIKGLGPDQGNAIAVAADGNTIYVTGRTVSDFDLPGFPAQTILCCAQPDVFVARLNGAGTLQWAHNLTSLLQAGPTRFADEGLGVATNAAGTAAFITGYTAGVMPTETSKGAEDIFIARYESDGTRTWVKQFGADIPATATRNDRGFGITLDSNGDVFVVGETAGTFGTPNPNTGLNDWFVLKMKASDGSLY